MLMEEYILKPWKRLLRDRAFVVCVLVLSSCAAGLQIGIQQLGLYLTKKPLSLQKPLDLLDEDKLLPFKIVNHRKIENEDVEAELGTKEYIYCYVEGPGPGQSDPLGIFQLFITYYTGDPDAVPHVPETCYTGAGSTIKGSRDMSIRFDRGGEENDRLPVRIVDIEESGMNGPARYTTVVYFFGVNGDFRRSRTGVRFRQNSLTEKYAYFSKVEFAFSSGSKPELENVLSIVEKLSGKLVPMLVAEHWPKWPPEE